MTAEIISGTEIRKAILAEIKTDVEKMKAEYDKVPGLVTILVGKNPASVSYVTLKVKTALSLGFNEIQDDQPEVLPYDDNAAAHYGNIRADLEKKGTPIGGSVIPAGAGPVRSNQGHFYPGISGWSRRFRPGLRVSSKIL